ncbi:MAG: hypothetical protein ACYCSI_00105 [Solirubrobacteraceae bacterium]
MPTISHRCPGGSTPQISHRCPGGSTPRRREAERRFAALAVARLLRRVGVALAALLLILPVGFESLASASTPSHGAAGTSAGLTPAPVDGYLTEAEEEEAEAEEAEDEAEELEEAEGTEEAEEGEAEAAEEGEGAEEQGEEEGAAASRHRRDRSAAPSSQHAAHETQPSSGAHATVSALALTQMSKSALSHGAAGAGRVSFSFGLSTKAKVQLTLAHSVGRSHWATVSSASVEASKGTDHAHLEGGRRLTTGQYRLTLTPSGGHAKQLTFAIK